jgi:PEP-CTERM motif
MIKRTMLIPLLALAVLPVLSNQANALPLLTFDLQPIQVCADDGTSCANPSLELFEAITDKIWAQADIDINFLDWLVVNDSNKLDETNFDDLTANASPSIMNVWFISTLSDCGGYFDPSTLFGCGGGNRAAVADLVFGFNSPYGRVDTFAHEIGHVLGLPHIAGASNLMATGSTRTIPEVIGDIAPDGAGLSFLSADQIATARSSSVLYDASVPEPGSIALFALGIVSLILARRRR